MRDDGFRVFVEDQLLALEGLRCRRMFGGCGLYGGELFFGIIADGRLYFKTDLRTRAAYRQYGMKPFRPSAKQTLKTYYEVPMEILEDDAALLRWAEQALLCQREAGVPRRPHKRGRAAAR